MNKLSIFSGIILSTFYFNHKFVLVNSLSDRLSFFCEKLYNFLLFRCKDEFLRFMLISVREGNHVHFILKSVQFMHMSKARVLY